MLWIAPSSSGPPPVLVLLEISVLPVLPCVVLVLLEISVRLLEILHLVR